MGPPPSDPGALQLTVAEPLPAAADTAVGAPGEVGGGGGGGGAVGGTDEEGELAGPVPAVLGAGTVRVWAVLLVGPGAEAGRAGPRTVADGPPPEEVTV